MEMGSRSSVGWRLSSPAFVLLPPGQDWDALEESCFGLLSLLLWANSSLLRTAGIRPFIPVHPKSYLGSGTIGRCGLGVFEAGGRDLG